jgi:long-chain fatty acid transport protein
MAGALMMIRSTILKLPLAASALVMLAGAAQAGGFAIREQSAEALGNAFAGVAAGTDGLSAMFWNPATISKFSGDGLVTEGDASLILPYSRAKDGAGFLGNPDSGNIGVTALVPSMYATYGINDQMTLGLAVTSPFGLSTDSDTWMGSPHGDVSKVRSLNINPVLAFKPARWITLAAGVEAEYASVDVSSSLPTGVPVFAAKGNDWGFGFTAGVLLQPSDYLDIGVGFRSSIHHKLTGDGMLKPFIPAGTFSTTLDTPETVTAGVRLQATDKLALKAGVEWANWSRFKSLDVAFDAPPVTVSTAENWKDSWYFSGGADYQATDALTLRAGLGYEVSPVDKAFRTPRLPDANRLWLSAGASYKVTDNLTTSLGYSHIFVDDAKVSLTSPTPLSANFKGHIDIFSAGATIDW